MDAKKIKKKKKHEINKIRFQNPRSELLDLQDRMDWRKCATSVEEEGLATRVIRQQFAPFDPKKKK